MSTESTVLVMAKAPVPGRVKTRLCPPCRPEEAAAIAEAALSDTLAAVVACGARRRVLALDGDPGRWLPPGFEVVVQRGETFADRLAHAWSWVSGPAIQIGMDTPQITPALLDQGIERVTAEEEAAIGPATDGGWWGLALRTPCPSVFAGVPMSTDRTGDAQVAALRGHGLEPFVLPPLCDIDTMADAVEVAALIPASRTARAIAAVTARAA